MAGLRHQCRGRGPRPEPGRPPALPPHAGRPPVGAGRARVFETYSVLTRLPVPLRLTAEQASSVLTAAFPEDCWLDPGGPRDLWRRLAPLGTGGGSVYDALVGQASAANGRILLTHDQRAERTSQSLGIEYRFVG